MIDTEAINSRYDMRELTGQYTDLKRKTAKEMAGPCPRCGGDDRFYVTADYFACRGCHDKRGRAIEFMMWLEGLPFREACDRLSGGDLPTLPEGTTRPAAPPPERLKPPAAIWQEKGRCFVADCQAALWSGEKAPDAVVSPLDWLRGRGLDDVHILAAGLGYNPQECYEDREDWELEPQQKQDGRPKRVWLPRAIVIPWEIDGALWGVRFRLPTTGKRDKYISVPGWKVGLYLAEFLRTDKPAVLCEGEIDALTVAAQAGDLAVPVATGSIGGARRAQWIARLALAPIVLVAFDNEADPDKKGQVEKAAGYWLDALPNAKRWRPYWKDTNQMAQDGADLRTWVAAGLA